MHLGVLHEGKWVRELIQFIRMITTIVPQRGQYSAIESLYLSTKLWIVCSCIDVL